MARSRRTWRDVDGARIEGTWRHVFIRNGDRHYLTDLVVYADGMVDCWGLGTLDEFAAMLASGKVVTEVPDGAEASALHLGSWKFAEPRDWVTADALLAEVRDEIDGLSGRPDSTARCLAAVDVFLAEQTEDNRAALHAAYHAIPEHPRVYALGDMDRQDRPLRVLAAGPGNTYTWWGDEELVTDEDYAEALAYFTGHTWAPAAKAKPVETVQQGEQFTSVNGVPE